MEEILNIFVENYFTEEFKDEVYKSFGLFTVLDYDIPFQRLAEISMSESFADNATMKDMFVLRLNEHLDFVLEQHKLKLTPEATVQDKNEIILALVSLLHVEDYTGIIRTLETFEPDEVMISEILSEFTMIPQVKIMELIDSVDSSMLQTLKDYIYQKEKDEQVEHVTDTKIVKHMKFFNDVFGKDNLAFHMVSGQILTGQPFETYLHYVKDTFSADKAVEQSALDILSVLYISSDGINSPLIVYRKNSHNIIENLSLITKIEVAILNHIAKFSEYKTAAAQQASNTNTKVTVNYQT